MVLLTKKLIVACLMVAALVCPALAAAPTEALKHDVDAMLLVLQEPGYANPATRPPLRQKIEQIVNTLFDFHEFSARTVGANWSSFSKDQQERFDKAFADLLLTTYLDKINGYNGEKVKYDGENMSQKGDRAEVQTVVTLADGKNVPVSYRMMLKNGKWVVYDVIIENISLIKNYRSQFTEVLTRGTPDQLIERVQARVAELKVAQ